MTQVVYYTGENTGPGPSYSIWADCPVLEIIKDPGCGIYFFDDFINFSSHISDQNTQQYASYIDTGVTITQSATEAGSTTLLGRGVVEIAGNDLDNDEGILQAGGGTGTQVVISDTAGSDKKLWFEARFKKASIADNALAFFLGLGEEGLTAINTLIDDTGEVADKDLIGFNNLHADGDSIDFLYNKAGGTITRVIEGVHVPVANTYVKLGFVYDPDKPTEERIAVFVNGVEQSTYVTGANIAAALFPDGEELSLLWATKVGASVESKAQLDWWRLAQLR